MLKYDFINPADGKGTGTEFIFFGKALEENAPVPFFCLNAYRCGLNGMEKDDEVNDTVN